MTNFACPHCRAEVSLDGFAGGEMAACGSCDGHFQVPAAAAAPASGAEAEGSSHTLERARRQRNKKSNPLLLAVLAAGGLVGAGAGVLVATVFFGGEPQTVTTIRQRDYPQGNRSPKSNARRAPDPADYRAPGPRLPMTRSQFRDRVAKLEFVLDPDTDFHWFVSGQAWYDAFGDPHRVRMKAGDQCLYWNCSDGTLHVVCKFSDKLLKDRNSTDGSAFIVKVINDEFY